MEETALAGWTVDRMAEWMARGPMRGALRGTTKCSKLNVRGYGRPVAVPNVGALAPPLNGPFKAQAAPLGQVRGLEIFELNKMTCMTMSL